MEDCLKRYHKDIPDLDQDELNGVEGDDNDMDGGGDHDDHDHDPHLEPVHPEQSEGDTGDGEKAKNNDNCSDRCVVLCR